MSTIAVQPFGRFGNTIFQYAYARAYAEQHGCDFECGEWIGQKVWQLDDKYISKTRPQKSELDIEDGDVDFEFKGYAQNQKCMIYTRGDVLRFFKLKPEWKQILDFCSHGIIAHVRRGDYQGYGYPLVSKDSYISACNEYHINTSEICFVSESTAAYDESCYLRGLDFLPDFLRMCKAHILLRANSSFSWWASTIGGMKTYSPVIDGKPGGVESHCGFVEGNHPRFCNLSFVTDLCLAKDHDTNTTSLQAP